MKKIITKSFNALNSDSFKNSIASAYANVYIMLARSVGWANTSNSESLDDSFVAEPYDTIEYKNDIRKKGIILKKISSSDIQPVVPRTDWVSGEVYFAYDQTANLYIKQADTAITSGNVNVSNILANTITTTNVALLNLAFTTPSIGLNDLIKIGEEIKEVVAINAAGDFIQVNSAFTSAYTANTLYLVNTSQYEFYNKFYVRNNLDQVFKCLANGNTAGTVSTSKPEITIGGQLPENPYIETADGYKWKYLYTISSGLKSKFFTDRYMPVTTDPTVVNSAEGGRIDIVQIVNGGNGYFNGDTTNNYPIVAVSGDGSGAQFTLDILNGVITEVNIVDGGANYTNMTLEIEDPLKLPGTSNGSLRAVISPSTGHGFNPVEELGSSEQMISVDFQSDVSEQYPTYSDGTTDYRQIALVRNPKLSNGTFGFTTVYPMYTKITVATPSIAPFAPDSIVYAGNSFSNAVFSATVVHFNSIENTLYVNDLQGDITSIDGENLYEKDNTGNYSQVFTYISPDINILSGDILYIENRDKITRNPNQTETVKIVVEF